MDDMFEDYLVEQMAKKTNICKCLYLQLCTERCEEDEAAWNYNDFYAK